MADINKNLLLINSECNLVNCFLQLLEHLDTQLPYVQTSKKLAIHLADFTTLY